MIDFASAKAIMIPEGNVIRIIKKLDGSPIWEKPGGSLPIGYTSVDYIESNGTQYIDTNYRVSSDNLKIVARFSLTEIQPWHALWGCEETNSGPWALTPLINGASALTFYSSNSDQIGSIPVTDNVIYLLECQSNNGILTYECGDASGELYPNGSICKTDNIYVFTINSFKDSSILGQASKMRLYYFQIYDNNVLVRDFVPCINASGETGLYDKVNNVFYGNAGTGEFIAKNTPALPTQDTLENMSWTDIQMVSKAGKASEYFAVGDQKTLSVNGVNYLIDIIGFDHDTPTDVVTYGRDKAGITFQLHELLSTTYSMNNSDTTSGSWSNAKMRTNTIPTLLGQLSSDLNTVIVPVDKLTSAGKQSTTIATTSDSLFLLSQIEVFGRSLWSVPGEGTQYDYYKNEGNKIKQIGTSNVGWWLRSPHVSDNACFCYVASSGGEYTNTASTKYGVSFAFCV